MPQECALDKRLKTSRLQNWHRVSRITGNTSHMFRNYLTAAIRNLRKNKGFSILNIAGLGVGIACAALILLWVEDEVTYDRWVPGHDHIARLMETQTRAG